MQLDKLRDFWAGIGLCSFEAILPPCFFDRPMLNDK
jgi:hypothetical protein